MKEGGKKVEKEGRRGNVLVVYGLERQVGCRNPIFDEAREWGSLFGVLIGGGLIKENKLFRKGNDINRAKREWETRGLA